MPQPDAHTSLGSLLEQRAAELGDAPFLRFEGSALSFREVNDAALAAALKLVSLRITPGDRVGLMLRNGFDYPIWWLAIAKAGAVAVPLNVKYERNDLAYVLNDAGAKLVVTSQEFIGVLNEALACGPGDWDILTVESVGEDASRETALTAHSSLPLVRRQDLLNIQYTSGTTGFPKGCMLSHDYWLTMGKRCVDIMSAGKGDINLTAQPFYYVDPQWNLVLCLFSGIPLVVLPRFSASTFWRTVREERVTFFYCVGTMPIMLFNQPAEANEDRRNCVRLVHCSGIPPTMHSAFEERWGAPWREVFGMTETGVDLAVSPSATNSVGTGSVGFPVTGKKAIILSPEGQEVPRDEIGELCVSGRPMMLGYWGQDEATAAALRNGWFHTGDLARQDSSGQFYIVGRLKDMVRRGGENIAAAEVEHALTNHPSIAAAAVVARPDDIRGEEVEAFILPKPGFELDPKEVLASLSGQIAAFKRPRFITIVRDLPLTPSERIEKHKLKEQGNRHVIRTFDADAGLWLDMADSEAKGI